MQNNTEKTIEQQNQPEINPQFLAVATSTQMSQSEMMFFVEEIITHCEYDEKIITGLIFLLKSFEHLAATNPTGLREQLNFLQRFTYQNSEDFTVAFSKFRESEKSQNIEVQI